MRRVMLLAYELDQYHEKSSAVNLWGNANSSLWTQSKTECSKVLILNYQYALFGGEGMLLVFKMLTVSVQYFWINHEIFDKNYIDWNAKWIECAQCQ